MTVDSQPENLTGFENNDDLDAFSAEFFGKAKPEKEVQEEVEEADIAGEHQEADVSDTDEVVEDSDVPEDESEEAPEEEAKPKKKTAQDRIKELTAERYEAQRALAAEKSANESRIAELERKLQEMSKPTAKAGTLPDGAPDPQAELENGELKYPLGEFDRNYILDLTKFTIAQEQAAAAEYRKQADQEAAVTAARQETQTVWKGKLEEAQAEIPDIVDKIASLDPVVANVDMGYQQYLVDVIMSLDNGPRVMAYLADNPDKAREIVSSGAASATVALGRLDGKMAKPPAERKVVTQAPKPAARTPRGTSGQFTTRPDTDDLDAFDKMFFNKS